MKKNVFFGAIFSLLVLAFTASAQTSDYSGTWTLDVSKSKLGDRNMIAEQTLTVVQTAKDSPHASAGDRSPSRRASTWRRAPGSRCRRSLAV